MQHIDLILTLTGGLAAALVLGYFTHRLGLSPIVGYLLAGLCVGPHTPGFVADHELAEQLAEVGVILLMFGVGLHFHLDELLAVRQVAVPGAIVQSLTATLLGALVARAFGWSWSGGFVFGLALSVASTVVLIRVLADHHDLHTQPGHIAVGWLVVEDLFTVLVLVLLPAIFSGESGGGGAGQVALATLIAIFKVSVLVAATFVIGGRLIPWLFEKAVFSGSRELFSLTVLTVVLGVAVGSTKLFGVSMALGAFLAGMVVGRSEFSLRAASEVLPMRDAFAVLFFVSVGMLLDPQHLLESPGLVVATIAVILIGKPLAAMVIVSLLGYPPKTALTVSVALAQIGEFSFILSSVGVQLGILDEDASQTLVAAAIVSITLNPILYRLTDPAIAWASGRPRLWKLLNARVVDAASATRSEREEELEGRHRAVVVGYGPVGQTVSRLLKENDFEPTVIEMNLETVRRLRAAGVPAVYGDASRRETLIMAGVKTAATLVLSSAGMKSAEEVIRLAKELNSDVRILARSTYVREMDALHAAGAQLLFSSEGEVALSMTETVLRELGATPDQIDRERDRVRRELTTRPPSSSTEASSAPAGADGRDLQSKKAPIRPSEAQSG